MVGPTPDGSTDRGMAMRSDSDPIDDLVGAVDAEPADIDEVVYGPRRC